MKMWNTKKQAALQEQAQMYRAELLRNSVETYPEFHTDVLLLRHWSDAVEGLRGYLPHHAPVQCTFIFEELVPKLRERMSGLREAGKLPQDLNENALNYIAYSGATSWKLGKVIEREYLERYFYPRVERTGKQQYHEWLRAYLANNPYSPQLSGHKQLYVEEGHPIYRALADLTLVPFYGDDAPTLIVPPSVKADTGKMASILWTGVGSNRIYEWEGYENQPRCTNELIIFPDTRAAVEMPQPRLDHVQAAQAIGVATTTRSVSLPLDLEG